MNKLIIIGNLTRAPELKTTPNGYTVCSFTVAVSRRRRQNASGQPEADYFQVSAWGPLGENCQRYLAKGRKVCVTGPVSVRAYQANDGSARTQMEMTAEEVEFLSSRNEEQTAGSFAAPAVQNSGFMAVETDELPF